jgi:hypothetical protein
MLPTCPVCGEAVRHYEERVSVEAVTIAELKKPLRIVEAPRERYLLPCGHKVVAP